MKKIYLMSTIVALLCISSLTVQPVSMNTHDSTPRNVILMVGDGIGFEHLRLGSFVEYGNDSGLFMQTQITYLGNVSTASANDQITDSAAAATAMATGYKADNGQLSLLPNGTSVQTILEYSQQQNMKTGLVTNSYFYHATPAAFASHQDSRYDHQDIIPDMLDSNTDLIFGGGLHLENLASVIGFDSMVSHNNYTQITEKNELLNIGKEKMLGTFGQGHITWEADVNYDTGVRLHQLTTAALNNLENEQGFFLMIEGARIDHAGHDNNVTRNALEVIAFDNTIRTVYDWVQDHPETTVIVTADHETGGLVIGDTSNLDNDLPSDYSDLEQQRDRRIQRVSQLDTSYTTSSHTGQDVPIFGFGLGITTFIDQNQRDNTDVYDMLKIAIDGELQMDTSTTLATSETGSTPNQSTTEQTINPIIFIVVILIPIFRLARKTH